MKHELLLAIKPFEIQWFTGEKWFRPREDVCLFLKNMIHSMNGLPMHSFIVESSYFPAECTAGLICLTMTPRGAFSLNEMSKSFLLLSRRSWFLTHRCNDWIHSAFVLNIFLWLSSGLTEWTSWFNIDHPGGNGDYERLEAIRFYYRERVCSRPTAMEARTTDWVAAAETGEVVHSSLEKGFWCINKEQPYGRTCSNYHVRFQCPPGSRGPRGEIAILPVS